MVRYGTRSSKKLSNSNEAKKGLLEASPLPMPQLPLDHATCCLDEKLITCDVCLEILYGPINCGPCNHKFCAACIYRWLDTSSSCPKCRNVVKETTKDAFAAQICEEYLKNFPNRARTTECKKEQDKMELEYLEKLIKRSRYNREARSYPNEEAERRDAESEQNLNLYHSELGGHPLPPRRLFLSNNRNFRENEWMTRARRLREDMKMPLREWTPEAENNERNEQNRRNMLHPLVRILGANFAAEDLGFFDDEAERNPAVHRVAFVIRRENQNTRTVRRVGAGTNLRGIRRRMDSPESRRRQQARAERDQRFAARHVAHRYDLRTRRNPNPN